ncbi:hypothetical protein ACPFUZ_003326 [Vibrio cholerae]
MYQKQPNLNELVDFKLNSLTINFYSDAFEFDIDFDNDELATNAFEVLVNIREHGYNSLTEADRDKLSPYTVEQLLAILDSQDFITDEESNTITTFSGRRLINEVEFHYKKSLLQKKGLDSFTKALVDKSISEKSLVKWTVQYHYLTMWAESIIGMSINSLSSGQLRSQLLDFFKEEIGHEKLLRSSIDTIDNLGAERVVHISMLAIVGSMLKFAMNDMASFLSYIYILEGDKSDSQRYIDVLTHSKLDSTFTAGQIKHEKININADHCDEAREISQYLEHVRLDDIERVKRNVEKYYFYRTYMNQYLIEDQYHPQHSISEIKQILSDNLDYLIGNTAPIAISQSIRDSNVRDKLSKLLSDIKEIDDPSNPIVDLYEAALFQSAYHNPLEYYNTIRFISSFVNSHNTDTPQNYDVIDHDIIYSLTEKHNENDLKITLDI